MDRSSLVASAGAIRRHPHINPHHRELPLQTKTGRKTPIGVGDTKSPVKPRALPALIHNHPPTFKIIHGVDRHDRRRVVLTTDHMGPNTHISHVMVAHAVVRKPCIRLDYDVDMQVGDMCPSRVRNRP